MLITQLLADTPATEQLGSQLLAYLPKKCLIFLRGQLGAGKTTLVRGFLQSAGHFGTVKSPTFTLVEPYLLKEFEVFHFDLYRLVDAEELMWIGIEDYLAQQAICFIEWAEQGAGILPEPDMIIELEIHNNQRFAKLHLISASLQQRYLAQSL